MSDRKLRAWQDAGLIDAATAWRIRDWEQANARPLLLWAVIGIGALAIGLGLVSVVAANWDAIPGQLRLAIHFAVMVGLSGWLWWRDPGLSRDHPWMHEAGVFVLGALGLTFMGHLGQVYQTSSPLWQPVGLWLLLFAPLLLGRGLSWLTAAMLFGGFLFAAWNHALEWNGPWPEGTETARMVREAALVSAPVLFGGASVWMAGRSLREAFWRRLGQMALAYAVVGASIMAIVAIERMPDERDAKSIFAAALVACGFGLASAAGLFRLRQGPSGLSRAGIMAGCAAMPVIAYGLSGDETVAALLFMALWAGIGAAALHAGWRGVFQAAVGVIAVRLIVLSFELAGDLLTSGAGLIVSGLLILGIAWGAVRVSKRFAPQAGENAP
ncbi:MAG: hypothetical protein RIQ46_2186 [Pseudomonadota bacterium]|jgi:uncharacterized membrane protein